MGTRNVSAHPEERLMHDRCEAETKLTSGFARSISSSNKSIAALAASSKLTSTDSGTVQKAQ